MLDLVYEIAHVEVGTGMHRANYGYSLGTSYRRSLAQLKARGLVKCDRYYPHLKGQPRVWEITEAGRATLEPASLYKTCGQKVFITTQVP